MYPILRSLDPHHQRIGYLGALATVSTRGLDSVAALSSRFQDLLFERIYEDDPRLGRLMDRIEPGRRQQLRSKARTPEDDPAAILSGPSRGTRWFYVSELWLEDRCMPSPLGFLNRDQVERTINLARWTGILLPTLELSEVGFILQKLLSQAAEAAREKVLFNLLNPASRPCLPVLYLRQILMAEMLFPFLVCELVDREAEGKPLGTRGDDGLLRATVERLITAVGEPTDPSDILAARDLYDFRSSILKSLSTEENYLRPRMEILVDLGIVGRKTTAAGRKAEFMWTITETTRRAAAEWRSLTSLPNTTPGHLDQRFFRTFSSIFGTSHRPARLPEERLLWFASAYGMIGRDFGFTPGRAVALLACLTAWESGIVLEISEVFDAVYGAARSEWESYLHFSGGSRFDREFLIRVDQDLLPRLEEAVEAGSAKRRAKAP
jgi:hypothetical protein